MVFISHSSKDKAIAGEICNHLESEGIKCWIAPRDIEAGSDWTTGIMRGIAACRILVLVFSAQANRSEHVGREVAQAFSMGLAVIPFRVEAVAPRESLSYFLATVHWLDATTPPFQNHLGSLTERVKRLLNETDRAVIAATEVTSGTKTQSTQSTLSKRSVRIAAVALASAVMTVSATVWFFTAQHRAVPEIALAEQSPLFLRRVSRSYLLRTSARTKRTLISLTAYRTKSSIMDALAVVSDYGIRERLEPQLNADEKRRFLEGAAEVQQTILTGSAETEESYPNTPRSTLDQASQRL
jgi:TIR domain